MARALTIKEHLWLHRRMELRAHELWLTGGGRGATALNDWLRAERETWEEFARRPGAVNAIQKRRGGARSAGRVSDWG